jgi:hypothetical protein
MEVGAKERGAMLTEKHDRGGDKKDGEQEIDAETFGMGHWVIGFYMRGEGERKFGKKAEPQTDSPGAEPQLCEVEKSEWKSPPFEPPFAAQGEPEWLCHVNGEAGQGLVILLRMA